MHTLLLKLFNSVSLLVSSILLIGLLSQCFTPALNRPVSQILPAILETALAE